MTRVQAAILASRSYPTFRRRLSVHDCRLCGLHAGRTNLVVDRGNPAARLLLIGEGPGADEDRLGQAFVGRSGRLLDQMLLETGIDPVKDVLIANVVKCRPPENRRPTQEEAEACLPYLHRQIALVRPKILGLLGATAAEHMLSPDPGRKMSEVVGKCVEVESLPGIIVMPLFHPAYILRNPRKRGEMLEHLMEIMARL